MQQVMLRYQLMWSVSISLCPHEVFSTQPPAAATRDQNLIKTFGKSLGKRVFHINAEMKKSFKQFGSQPRTNGYPSPTKRLGRQAEGDTGRHICTCCQLVEKLLKCNLGTHWLSVSPWYTVSSGGSDQYFGCSGAANGNMLADNGYLGQSLLCSPQLEMLQYIHHQLRCSINRYLHMNAD